MKNFFQSGIARTGAFRLEAVHHLGAHLAEIDYAE